MGMGLRGYSEGWEGAEKLCSNVNCKRVESIEEIATITLIQNGSRGGVILTRQYLSKDWKYGSSDHLDMCISIKLTYLFLFSSSSASSYPMDTFLICRLE